MKLFKSKLSLEFPEFLSLVAYCCIVQKSHFFFQIQKKLLSD